MNISQHIKHYREAEKLTQKELAAKLFISESTIGHYETGNRTPSIDMLKSIANIVKVELDDFFKEETKRLLPLPFTREELIKRLEDRRLSHHFFELQPSHLVMYLESDRFFVALHQPYHGYAMTFLVWLVDGFHFIPVKTAEWDEWNEEAEEIYVDRRSFLDVKNIKKVSKADVPYIRQASGRSYIKAQNEQRFSESIYVSRYDTMDFTLSSYEELLFDDMYHLHYFMNEEAGELYAYDPVEDWYYVKTKEGVFRTRCTEKETDDFGCIVFLDTEMEKRIFLSEKEISNVKEMVLIREKEMQLLLHEWEHSETQDLRKDLIERYRYGIAFVDKMKRIISLDSNEDFLFLPEEETVKQEEKTRKETEHNEALQQRVKEEEKSATNKVAVFYEGYEFPHPFYRDLMIVHTRIHLKYPLVGSFTNMQWAMEWLLHVRGTSSQPNVILLRLKNDAYTKHYIEMIKEVDPEIKIVVVMPFVSGESMDKIHDYLEKGADSFLIHVDNETKIQLSIEAALDGSFKEEN